MLYMEADGIGGDILYVEAAGVGAVLGAEEVGPVLGVAPAGVKAVHSCGCPVSGIIAAW